MNIAMPSRRGIGQCSVSQPHAELTGQRDDRRSRPGTSRRSADRSPARRARLVEESEPGRDQAEQRRRHRRRPRSRRAKRRRRASAPGCGRASPSARRRSTAARAAAAPTGAATSTRGRIATWAQAVRQPLVRTRAADRDERRREEARSAAPSRRPSPRRRRRSNDLPTAVMLATDSALCPSARVASTSRNRIQAPPARRLIVHTTAARSSVSASVVPRRPTRSNRRPIGRQIDRAEQRGPEIDVRVGDAIEPEVAQHRLGDQAEPLRSPRQRREHDHRRDDDVDPAGPRADVTAGSGRSARIADAAPTRHRKNVEVLPYSAYRSWSQPRNSA